VKLIVGLGNPGKEYEKTRHNIGFMMIDNYISSNNIVDKWSSKFNGKYIKDKINGEDTIFLKPQSYMNLSGGVVKKYVDYFKIPLENIIVISDDMDLFVGNFKIKDKGSCGGHNGLRDIEKNLGTSVYKRIKIGIAKDKSIDTKDYVLGKLSKEDYEIINDLSKVINEVIDDFYVMPFGDMMSKYNRKNR